MNRAVEVRTGARLHFGLFATAPGDGPFGGIGMMVQRPGFVLRAMRAPQDCVIGPPELCRRVTDLVARIRRGLTDPSVRLQIEAPSDSVEIRISETIAPHRGLGSGTQLAYAVSAAVQRVLGVWPPVTPVDNLGRGGRSAVGTLGFREGGFLVDPGRHQPPGLKTGVTRRKVPPEWRFVVVDPHGRPGPSGATEAAGFRSLPAMPRRMPGLLFDLVAHEIVPGLDDRDFRRFSAGVAHFNRLVGEHFAPAQGGVYAHPLVRELSRTLAGTYWPHLAQSSWGPAAAVFCESEESAAALHAFLARELGPDHASVFVAEPKNDGATVVDLVSPD